MTASQPGGSVGGSAPQVGDQWRGVPDWLSPRLLIALSSPLTNSVVVPAGTEVTLARRNPGRIGLLVVCPNGSAADFRVSPVRGLGASGIALGVGANFFLASLSDWLSLMCDEWFGFSVGGVTVSVTELVRPF